MGPPVADAVAADVPAQRSPHAGNPVQRLCHGEAATEGSKDTVACRCLVLAEDCSSIFSNLIGEAAGRALQCRCRMALFEMALGAALWYGTYAQPQNGIGRAAAK